MEAPYFTGLLSLVRFPGGSTEWAGQRGKMRVVVGDLDDAVLQWLRDDPFWAVAPNLSWTAKDGSTAKDSKVHKRMRAEVATKKGPWANDSGKNNVKIQIAGRCGETERKSFNGLSCETDLDAERSRHWIEAFRRANQAGLEQFNAELRRRLLQVQADNRGVNGEALLDFEAGGVQTS